MYPLEKNLCREPKKPQHYTDIDLKENLRQADSLNLEHRERLPYCRWWVRGHLSVEKVDDTARIF